MRDKAGNHSTVCKSLAVNQGLHVTSIPEMIQDTFLAKVYWGLRAPWPSLP